jgi:hypothetical protein
MARDLELYERVKALWLDSGLTAQQIGDRLGKSRSAVLGMVHRMGINRGAPARPARAPRPPAAPKAPKPPKAEGHALAVTAQPRHNVNPLGARTGVARTAAAPALIRPDELTATARPWIDRGPQQCPWPIVVDGETFSCCARMPEKAKYCAAHAQIAFSAKRPDRRALMKLASIR